MISFIPAVSAWTLGECIHDEVSNLLDAIILNTIPLKEAFQIVVQDYRELCDFIRSHSICL